MYNYQTERPYVFTEAGQVQFLAIRDNVKRLLKLTGCVRMQEAIAKQCGSSWQMLACVDRLVELKEIREITTQNVAGQHRVFVDAHSDF